MAPGVASINLTDAYLYSALVVSVITVAAITLAPWLAKRWKGFGTAEMPHYEVTELFYVRHRRWFSLALGFIPILLVVYLDYVSIFPAPNIMPTDVAGYEVMVVIDIIGVLFAAYPIWLFLHSRRLEFYGAFVRVFDARGGGYADVPYSDIRLGWLSIGGLPIHQFGMWVKSPEKEQRLSVVDGQLKGSPYTLYTWLSSKTDSFFGRVFKSTFGKS